MQNYGGMSALKSRFIFAVVSQAIQIQDKFASSNLHYASYQAAAEEQKEKLPISFHSTVADAMPKVHYL